MITIQALLLISDWTVFSLQASLDICEILAFSIELDNEDADKVEAYLARKWGLTDQLPADHPYVSWSIAEVNTGRNAIFQSEESLRRKIHWHAR